MLMRKEKFPVTPAIRALRAAGIVFAQAQYAYEEHGGAAQSARELGADLHAVIKTIVLADENGKGLIMLMHGDCEVSTRNLARQLGRKHLEPASAAQAQKWTGYQFGGTSPFGLKTRLPIAVQASIYDLDSFWINGGKRGFQVKIRPADLAILEPIKADAAVC